MRVGAYRQFWKMSGLLNEKEDAANNYARAYINVGRKILPALMEEIRSTAEVCDNLTGFNLVHSFAGGTGSGLTTLLAECLHEEYFKKFRFSTSIYPSRVYSHSTVDPYNTLLAMKATIEPLDCSIIMDNKALSDRCVSQLDIEKPTFTSLNRFVATLLSSMYLSHRFTFTDSQHADVSDLLTNLIPYPRIHYPIVCASPLFSKKKQGHKATHISTITRSVFTQDAVTLDCNIQCRCFISAAMLYRGKASPSEVSAALRQLRSGYMGMKIGDSFVDWCPAMFKVGLTPFPPVTVPSSTMGTPLHSVCMVAGNTAVADTFKSTVDMFDMLFKRCGFVHWFVCEGLEEAELTEARDGVCDLIKEYTDLVERRGTGDMDPEQSPEAEDNNSLPIRTQSQTDILRRYPEANRRNERIMRPANHGAPFQAGRGTPNPWHSGAQPISINSTINNQRSRIPFDRPPTECIGRSVAPPLPCLYREMDLDNSYVSRIDGGYLQLSQQTRDTDQPLSPWAVWDIPTNTIELWPVSQAQFWRL